MEQDTSDILFDLVKLLVYLPFKKPYMLLIPLLLFHLFGARSSEANRLSEFFAPRAR